MIQGCAGRFLHANGFTLPDGTPANHSDPTPRTSGAFFRLDFLRTPRSQHPLGKRHSSRTVGESERASARSGRRGRGRAAAPGGTFKLKGIGSMRYIAQNRRRVLQKRCAPK
jgi:hypothetical protein